MENVKKWKNIASGMAFLAPSLVGFIIFIFLPILVTLMLSFTSWDASGLEKIGFEGFANYAYLLEDSFFWSSLFNTLVLMAAIPVSMLFALVLALALRQKVKGFALFKTIYLLPYFTTVLAVALLFQWIFNGKSGILNEFLRIVGFTDPPYWLGSKFWAKPVLIIFQVWRNVGFNIMLYLVALQMIPSTLYDAADMDGATAWQKFSKITWPHLGSTNIFIILVGIFTGFQVFTEIYVLTAGGPKGTTMTTAAYYYITAFQPPIAMGYASAIAVFLFLVMMTITILLWRFKGKDVL